MRYIYYCFRSRRIRVQDVSGNQRLFELTLRHKEELELVMNMF
jgi:hypothetical protein